MDYLQRPEKGEAPAAAERSHHTPEAAVHREKPGPCRILAEELRSNPAVGAAGIRRSLLVVGNRHIRRHRHRHRRHNHLVADTL